MIGLSGEMTQSPVNGSLEPTETICVIDAWMPRSFVTVNVTLNVPPLTKL